MYEIIQTTLLLPSCLWHLRFQHQFFAHTMGHVLLVCVEFCCCIRHSINIGADYVLLAGRPCITSVCLCLVRSCMTAVPLYAQSKQASGYKAFTRQSCPTFPLCASAAGLRCIIHEHSVNLLIQNMSSLFLCLIYCLSFSHSVIFASCSPFSPSCFPLLLFFHQQRRNRHDNGSVDKAMTGRNIHDEVEIMKGVTMKNAEMLNKK